MEDLRNYLKILEDMTDLLTNLPRSCESYCDTFYDDMICLIDNQYDKMYCKLKNKELESRLKEGEKYETRNGTNF